MTKAKLSEHDADNKNLDSPVNIVSDKIGLKRFANTGRGVVAKTDINMNETILQIHNLITPLIAAESDSELVDMLENSPDSSIDIQDLMTLWMISQSEKDSVYKGYIKSLPQTSTCPLAVYQAGAEILAKLHN